MLKSPEARIVHGAQVSRKHALEALSPESVVFMSGPVDGAQDGGDLSGLNLVHPSHVFPNAVEVKKVNDVMTFIRGEVVGAEGDADASLLQGFLSPQDLSSVATGPSV